ncbi:hypothetical protein N7516_005674 [Penicillium verrucosum]|uniref:uncharacterized protein n=1 Tax=Penicillium verrucosum TaxID=60171 RepID=UPI0025453661|nr:uncharacterized protein N7516_005674 [Penicillium verrucosum]KAJ5931185.1 hypothetical protein N7516_005674 [Penicillium verrucosum]
MVPLTGGLWCLQEEKVLEKHMFTSPVISLGDSVKGCLATSVAGLRIYLSSAKEELGKIFIASLGD